jgi:hypothetical protein
MDISITVDIAQLIFTVLGGVYALVLFHKTNIEKKNIFIIAIYDRFYNDTEIRKILYVVDKEEREMEKIKYNGRLEKEADKTLRFLQYIGQLINDKQLKLSDIHLFKYEIDTILNNFYVQKYIDHLNENGVILKNLNVLKTRIVEG